VSEKEHQLFVVVRQHLNHPSRDLPARAEHQYLSDSFTHAAPGRSVSKWMPRARHLHGKEESGALALSWQEQRFASPRTER